MCRACVRQAFLRYLKDLAFPRINNLRRINRGEQFESLSLRHGNELMNEFAVQRGARVVTRTPFRCVVCGNGIYAELAPFTLRTMAIGSWPYSAPGGCPDKLGSEYSKCTPFEAGCALLTRGRLFRRIDNNRPRRKLTHYVVMAPAPCHVVARKLPRGQLRLVLQFKADWLEFLAPAP